MTEYISVGERLPQTFGRYTVVLESGERKMMWFNPVQTIRFPKGFSEDTDYGFVWRRDDVVAWAERKEE